MCRMRWARIRINSIVRLAVMLATIGGYGYMIFFGENSMRVYWQLRKAITKTTQEFSILSCEIDGIKANIASWKEDDFMLEKMAREELLMGHPDELVYVLNR